MKTAQSRIVTQLAQFTTIVNHTYDEVQANRDQINLISGGILNLTQYIDGHLSQIGQQFQYISQRIDVEVLLTQIEAIGNRYVRAHEAWLHRKENLEAGRLTENILPPSVLTSILSTDDDQLYRMITPIQWYYEHVTITPIWTSDQLIYRTRLPVIAGTRWHYIAFQAWPMPLREWQATVTLPATVLRNTETGELDVSPRCSGARPRVCKRGLISRANAYPCLTRLLDAEPRYDSSCVLTMERRMPMDMVYPQEYNHYILITGGTALVLRCAGESEQSTTLNPGVYRLTLKFPCTLHSDEWTLSSTFQRSLNATLQDRPEKIRINFTISDMFSNISNGDPLIYDLKQMDPVDRKQISVSDFTQPFDFKFTTSKSRYLWHLFWLLLIVVVIIGGVFVYRRYRCRKTESGKNTSNDIPMTIQGAASSVDTTLFQFKGQTNDIEQTQ